MRPVGPEIEMAAMTWPEALRIGAEIEHTPSSRSVHGLGPAALAYGGQLGGGELGVAQSLVQTVGILPSQKNLGGGTGFHRQHGTHRNGIT